MASMRMTKTCPRCGVVFEKATKLSRRQWDERVHCSKACSAQTVGEARKKPPRVCPQCGKQTGLIVKGTCQSCYGKARWRDPALREANLAVRREWRERHPGYWDDERFRAPARERTREWVRRNPERARANHLNGKHMRRVREGTARADAREYVVLVKRDPCSYCGGRGGTLDHITALSRGGGHEWENLTGACRACNGSKFTASPLLFLLRSHKSERAAA